MTLRNGGRSRMIRVLRGERGIRAHTVKSGETPGVLGRGDATTRPRTGSGTRSHLTYEEP